MFAVNKREYFRISIIIVIFIFSRLLFLFFTPYAYYGEEAKIGTIGHDIVFEKQLKLPFWGYLDSPHAGGSLFSGLAAIPFYFIFGDRYLALKLTALTFSLLSLILWYKLLSSETKAPKETFILSLIFFTFATPHYVQKSVVIGGSAGLMFFNILTIFYFWKIRKDISANNRSYFLLGCLCGFAFWVNFMSFYLFLTTVLILYLIKKFNTVIIHTLYLIIGFVLGALPLWIYNLQYQWASLTADARGYYMHFCFDITKLKHLVFIDLPASFHFLDINGLKAQYLGFTVYGLFIIAVLIHLGKNLMYYLRKGDKSYSQKRIGMNLEIFLILYIFVFFLITSFTPFPIGGIGTLGWNSMNVHAEYYIVSLQLIIFALIILLNKYKNKIIFLVSMMTGVILILGYCNLFQQSYYNNTLFEPMYSTGTHSYECGFNFVFNPKLFLRYKQRISNEEQREYIRGAKDTWKAISQETKKRILGRAESLGLDYVDVYLRL